MELPVEQGDSSDKFEPIVVNYPHKEENDPMSLSDESNPIGVEGLYELLVITTLGMNVSFFSVDENTQEHILSAFTDEVYIPYTKLRNAAHSGGSLTINYSRTGESDPTIPKEGLLAIVLMVHNMDGNEHYIQKSKYEFKADGANNSAEIVGDYATVLIQYIPSEGHTNVVELKSVRIQLNAEKTVEYLASRDLKNPVTNGHVLLVEKVVEDSNKRAKTEDSNVDV